ncbi:SDR family oxidoreductase [Streptomyces olivoreticuli]|uniref:SDR family oxidoreductase n=1 Tax=Streptomyces olivoreticuli TaxID=68246 RepID=UPI00346305D0
MGPVGVVNVGMTRALALELGTRNVTATVVAPGCAETGMTASLTDHQHEHIRSQIPVGRAARPEETAAACPYAMCVPPSTVRVVPVM